MRDIVAKCNEVEKTLNLENKQKQKPKRDGERDKEAVKLRLRGRGSGYKENNRKEISEALHLCISSKYEETQDVACTEIEWILTDIAAEYKEFARDRKLKHENLNWRKIEMSQTLASNSSNNSSIKNLDRNNSDLKSQNSNGAWELTDSYAKQKIEDSGNKNLSANQRSATANNSAVRKLSDEEQEYRTGMKRITFSGERVG